MAMVRESGYIDADGHVSTCNVCDTCSSGSDSKYVYLLQPMSCIQLGLGILEGSDRQLWQSILVERRN